MKKLLLLLCAFASLAAAQITYTPGSAPQAAVPTKVVATAGSGASAVSCTLTGDTFPATKVTIACTVGGVTISPYTVPFAAGTAYTFQHNYNGNVLTLILSEPTGGGAIAFQANNGGSPTTGSF